MMDKFIIMSNLLRNMFTKILKSDFLFSKLFEKKLRGLFFFENTVYFDKNILKTHGI